LRSAARSRCCVKRPRAHNDEPLGLCVRQRAQEDGIDDAEHRGVRADTQRKSDDDDGAEARIPGTHPEGIAHVSPDLVEPRSVTSRSDMFLRLFDPAKIEHGQTACLSRRRPVTHLVGGGHVDKGLQFVIQILLGPVSMD